MGVEGQRVLITGAARGLGLAFALHLAERGANVMGADVLDSSEELARAEGLPVIIHSREADEETLEILRAEYAGAERGGVMHCFGGGPALAAGALELGFYISFAGNVTFKKAEALREVALTVPLERLLVETDCPYLAPVPHRGRRNEPAYVAATARFLAELRGVGPEAFGRATSENFSRLFGLSVV